MKHRSQNVTLISAVTRHLRAAGIRANSNTLPGRLSAQMSPYLVGDQRRCSAVLQMAICQGTSVFMGVSMRGDTINKLVVVCI